MTFVLVPGAGGDTWFWSRLVPLLEAGGHRVLPVELPAGDESAGIDAYADVVVEAVAGRDDVILVAQSLGGFTAAAVAARVPVRGLVMLNAMIPAPGETAGEWWSNTGQGAAMRAAAEAEGRDPDAEFDDLEIFFHDVPQEVVDEAYAQGEPAQSETPFGTPPQFEEWPDVPTLVLVGRDDRIFPREFQCRVARERLAVDAEVLPGGHCLALSQPAALADRLLAYASEA